MRTLFTTLREFVPLTFKRQKEIGKEKMKKNSVIFPHESTQQTWLIAFCLISKVILKQKGQGDNSHLFCYKHNEN